MCGVEPNLSPNISFFPFHKSREPFSRAPAITPVENSSLLRPQAMSWNLPVESSEKLPDKGARTSGMVDQAYLESVLMLAVGCNSTVCSRLPRSKSHSSNWVSLEKSASTAPALVPVAIHGKAVPGDQANVAVRGISRRRTIMEREMTGQQSGLIDS